MKRKIGVFFLLGVASMFGQMRLTDVTKAVTLKYPNRVDFHVLDGIGLVIKQAGDVVVITGPQERVDTAEAILKQLDVPAPPRPVQAPRKDIQLTAYLIIASPTGTPGTPLPKDLEPAVSQVASILPYKAFNLFDAVIMRVADNEGGTVGGVLPTGQQTFANGGTFSLRLSRIIFTEATPANLFELRNFDLMVLINHGMDIQGKEKTQTVNVGTNIDMKEGQKIVVGKANIDGSENALIVILTAKVVD